MLTCAISTPTCRCTHAGPGGEPAPSAFAIGFDYREEGPADTTSIYPMAAAGSSGGADYRSASDPTSPTTPTNPDPDAAGAVGLVDSGGVRMDAAGYVV